MGYHGATVEQIAAALQMNKGNLYYYFKSKEEILFACHEYSHDRLQELLAETCRGSAPPEAKLRRLIHAAVHVILDELRAIRCPDLPRATGRLAPHIRLVADLNPIGKQRPGPRLKRNLAEPGL